MTHVWESSGGIYREGEYGAVHAMQEIRGVDHPWVLSIEQKNLLALYGLEPGGNITHASDGNVRYTIVRVWRANNITPVRPFRPDLWLVLEDSIEAWQAEIKDFFRPKPEGPTAAQINAVIQVLNSVTPDLVDYASTVTHIASFYGVSSCCTPSPSSPAQPAKP